MSSKKRTFINLSAQAICFLVNFCISFFLVPYIGETVGADAYGFVGLANDFVGYAQLITIALNSMASRFITIKIHEKDYDKANKYYSSVIISNLVLSAAVIVISAIFIIFMDKIINVPAYLITDVRLLFIMIFINFVFSITTSTFAIATFCTNKLYLSSIKTIESQILRVAVLLIAFKFLKPSIWFVGLAALLSTLYVGTWNYYYIKKLLPDLKLGKDYFDFKCIKELLSSGIWNTFSKLSSILSSGLDLLISNIFIGSLGMTLLSYSKTFINLILNAFGTVSGVFSPELTISYAKKQYKEMEEQLLYAIKIFSFVSAIPLSFLFAYGMNVYKLWIPTQNPTLLYWLTLVSGCSLVLTTPLEPLWNLFTVKNKVKQSSLYLIINSFLTILIVFVLLNVFKDSNIRMFVIAGVSSVFAIIRGLTFLPLFGAKCLEVKKTKFYTPVLKNVFLVGVVTIICMIFKRIINPNTWLLLFVSALVTVVVSSVAGYLILFTREERKNLKETIVSKLNVIRNKVN